MSKQRVKFTYEKALVTVPVIYELGKRFNVITNIRRANVRDDMGWVVLELEGDTEDIGHGLQWVKAMGVRVDPVAGDVVEG